MVDVDLYKADFFAWTQAQASAIRAVARGGNAPIDWENVAEEIETLGRSDRHEIINRIETIIEHLLKLSFSPAQQPRHGWVETVLRTRAKLEDLLDESPSLRSEVPAMVARLSPKTARLVADILAEYRELTPELRAALLATSFTPEQVLGDWLPAARP
jgi:hypothetical protein